MLKEAGLDPCVHPPDIDDAVLKPGAVGPAIWVVALAYLKARRVADLLHDAVNDYAAWWDQKWIRAAQGTVLGADTVCVAGNELLGQPRDAADARRMLQRLRNAEHQTITGVCLLSLDSMARFFLFDRATVRIGALSDRQIQEYIANGGWRGKAGAYNLSERINAGWPIECAGDPATVMGLPMQRLKAILDLES